MNYHPENSSKERKCSSCKEIKPLNDKFFGKDKARRGGFCYECKGCRRVAKKYYTYLYRSLSESEKNLRREKVRTYKDKLHVKAGRLISRYKSVDRSKGQLCDLTIPFVVELIQKMCAYCGTSNDIGCDRKDNSLGHIMENVVPCCGTCNTTKMDNFSYEEMKILGKTIAIIKEMRSQDSAIGKLVAKSCH